LASPWLIHVSLDPGGLPAEESPKLK